MKQRLGLFLGVCGGRDAAIGTGAARAQVTAAEGYTPVDDTPSVKVGGTIFADYTYQLEPTADGLRREHDPSQRVQHHPRLHQRHRPHLAPDLLPHHSRRRARGPVPGTDRQRQRARPDRDPDLPAQVRVRPDQLRRPRQHDHGRVLQLHGSWLRLGMQQTPFVDFVETIYRYRFQGTVFPDREGFLSSSDLGASRRTSSSRATSATSTSASTTARRTRRPRSTTRRRSRSADHPAPSDDPDPEGPAPDRLLRRRPLRQGREAGPRFIDLSFENPWLNFGAST